MPGRRTFEEDIYYVPGPVELLPLCPCAPDLLIGPHGHVMTQNDFASRQENPTSHLDTAAMEPRLRESAVESGSIAEQRFVGEHSANSSPEDIAAIIRHRRRLRMLRFVAFETIAIGVMIVSAFAGISSRFAAESLTPIFRVLPVSAAIVAVILPIVFFGDPKRRNRARCNDKRKARG
jgi:hypothetical protein